LWRSFYEVLPACPFCICARGALCMKRVKYDLCHDMADFGAWDVQEAEKHKLGRTDLTAEGIDRIVALELVNRWNGRQQETKHPQKQRLVRWIDAP
jgi:hypothetical protein